MKEIKKSGAKKVFYSLCPVCETEFTFMLQDVVIQKSENGKEFPSELGISMELIKTMMPELNQNIHRYIECPECKHNYQPPFQEYEHYLKHKEYEEKCLENPMHRTRIF